MKRQDSYGQTSKLVGSALIFLFLAGVVTPPVMAEDDELPLRLNAVASNMSNVGPRGQARIQINVTRWSTEEERNELLEALKASGDARNPRTLADTLFKQEIVGTFRETTSLAENLRYSRRVEAADGSQMIILATDRPLAFFEVWRATRSTDYNVSLIVLNLDADGRGEGQLFGGAQLSWDSAKDQVIIEGFASEPIRLNNVRLR